MTFSIILLAVAACIALSYLQHSLIVTALTYGAITLLSMISNVSPALTLLLAAITIITGTLSIPSLRINLISKKIHLWFRKVLPEISETEQEAIDAGTVWWDGELFSGKPDWQKLLTLPKPGFTDEEQAFIDGPANELCRMVDNWDINHNTTVIPEKVEQFIKEKGFLGMIIPKEYGGLEFSGMAQTEIITKISATGGCVSNFINVPNSLGPGELLMKYGTEEQKKHYLPRLASGIDVPCFALTGALAGSDATSLPDTGIICKGTYKGKKVLGMKLNFKKRYITLAPVATLIGLAFRLQDPDHLIGDIDDYGITCALIPRETKGVNIGRRHKPIGDAFLNGPIEGDNVFVPLDYIIGGPEMAGKGWAMLVNCLSVGRCVTLPSVSNSMSKHLLMGTTAYAALRQQFGLPISKFEGVQKPLARMAGLAYIINAARLHTAQSLSHGEKPSVPSAIIKYHLTEMARQVSIDAMDIHGGKAIMTGPKNYVADSYSSVPIAITVEGANIMTRNLMIFGQGATRSHPYVLKEMQLANDEVTDDSTAAFDDVFFKHVGFSLTNGARAFVMGLTGSHFASSPTENSNSKLKRHYQELNRLSAAFALIADISMLTLQSKLKFKEMLSARLGDLLSNLYLASMVLKHYENSDCPEEEYPVIEWCMSYLMNRYQLAMQEILQNYPNRFLAFKMKATIFPLGAHFDAPSDELSQKLATLFTSNSETRQRLLTGCFSDNLSTNPIGQVNATFMHSLELAPLFKKIRLAIKAGEIEKALGAQQIELALTAKVITDDEAKQLSDFDDALMDIIHVDHFAPEELIRTNKAKPRKVAKAS
ncbi:MAG: acyl-CoA dehydrogenase [Arenicella sp.]